MTLLSQHVEIHYTSSYENFRIYLIVLWEDHPFRSITVTQRISMKMFSHIYLLYIHLAQYVSYQNDVFVLASGKKMRE